MNAPTLTWRTGLGAAALLLAVLLAFVLLRGDDQPASAPSTPPQSPTTPATTPAPAAAFPTDCTPVAGSRPLGLGIPRPARLAQNPVEQATFDAAFACLQAVSGQTPVLRTQLPIDVTRRRGAPGTPGANEFAELQAFAELINRTGARGVISVRSHDFTTCPSRGEGRPSSRSALQPEEPLESCEYPSLPLYEQLFREMFDALGELAPDAQLWWSAWNEPDHPAFTLQRAYGRRVAARRAGKYWTVVAGLVGSERALAGEFSDQDLPTLLSLRDAFVDGTGGLTPSVWALHAYRDLTEPVAGTEDAFARAVAPAAVWSTEVTPRISGKKGLSGRPTAQRRRGAALRTRLTESQTPLILYLLTPPPPPQTDEDDGWDSALADRQGRARPFVCGLAELPPERCAGSPEAFGGG